VSPHGPASAAGEAREAPSRLARVLRAVVGAPVVLYQRAISPALPQRCKYEPTCSRYALEAIGRYGVARGVVLAAWRLLRCNPWSYGGYDPVQAQTLFRSRPARDEPPARAAGPGSAQRPSLSPPSAT
jgi:uncharacterized protein